MEENLGEMKIERMNLYIIFCTFFHKQKKIQP